MLLSTRHLPSDPSYSVAINLVPAEFNGKRAVMAAWHEYIEAVRYQPSEENREKHDAVVQAKQTTLLFKMMRSLGFKLSEGDIKVSAYASSGFVWRDNMYLDYLAATREIAEALKRQTELIEAGVAAQAQEPQRLPASSESTGK